MKLLLSVQAPDEQLAAAAAAAFELAVMTLTGLAGGAWPRNETLGMHMLHAAAKGGSMEAELSLSNRYMLGEGVPQDCEEAIRSALHTTIGPGPASMASFLEQKQRQAILPSRVNSMVFAAAYSSRFVGCRLMRTSSLFSASPTEDAGFRQAGARGQR